MNKKGIADPFDISGRIGYYILVIMIMSVLFLFIAVFSRGVELKYYRSNFGVGAVNMEERALRFIEYTDPVTNFQYSKVIDLNKMMQSSDSSFSDFVGITDSREDKGLRVVLGNRANEEITSIKTINFIDGQEDFTNTYPVLYIDDGEFRIGIINISFWKT